MDKKELRINEKTTLVITPEEAHSMTMVKSSGGVPSIMIFLRGKLPSYYEFLLEEDRDNFHCVISEFLMRVRK